MGGRPDVVDSHVEEHKGRKKKVEAIQKKGQSVIKVRGPDAKIVSKHSNTDRGKASRAKVLLR